MKKLSSILILLLLSLCLFISCSDDDEKDVEEVKLTVASVKLFEEATETLTGVPNNIKTKVYIPPRYLVKLKGGSEWIGLIDIANFEHQEGYEYLIRAKKEKIEGNIAQTLPSVTTSDLYGYQFTFLEEISKTKKDSENIPIQQGMFRLASRKTGDADYPYYVYEWKNEGWLKSPKIEGFTHEDGYEYHINISAKYLGASATPKYSYTLISELNKEKKDSEGLPEQ